MWFSQWSSLSEVEQSSLWRSLGAAKIHCRAVQRRSGTEIVSQWWSGAVWSLRPGRCLETVLIHCRAVRWWYELFEFAQMYYRAV